MSRSRSIASSAGRHISYANVASTLALVMALGTGTAYAANTVRSRDIVDGQVKARDLAAGAVTSAKLMDGGVTAVDLGPESVSAASLQPAVVGSGSVLDESLTNADLATNSVGATEVADDSIDGGEIVNDSLGAIDLAGGSVGSSELADESVTAADLDGGSVGASEVLNNSLTMADIAGADVNGGGINVPAGYVPDGRCRQLDASVGGASAGEAVLFSVKAAIQDGMLIYGQRVPSDDHVTFSVCNFTGGAMVAISNLPVRVITFG